MAPDSTERPAKSKATMLPVKRSSRERADGESVSELTTARLSVYLRSLEALEAAGVNTVSSQGAGRAVPV